MFQRSRRSRQFSRIVALAPLLIVLTTIVASAQSGGLFNPASVIQDNPTGHAATGSRTIAAGTIVQAQSLSTPPALTDAQRQEREARTAQSHRSGPNVPRVVAPEGQARGAEAAQPGIQPAAATDFTIFRDSIIPSSGISGGYSSASYTQEPSTEANGKVVFQTGNWYASRSYNNGATWSYLNPYSIFGTDHGGFCCDQVTIYDKGRGREFWLLQFGSGLKLASSAGTDLSSWCYYTIDPTWFGLPTTTALDYNDMNLGTNDLYITTNLFPSGGGQGSALLRLPLDSLASCSGFSYNYLTAMDWFTWKPVQGAHDVMYWGSNWGNSGANGARFRLYSWAENSSSYFWYDRTIDAFNFEIRNGGQNCGSASHVVNNWCQFADSRVLGGYVANGVIGFSFNATQGSGYPFPYSRRVYFRESDKAYTGYASFWASWGAFQFMSLAPNTLGHIGGTFAWGGGTGTTNYYPGAGLLIDDDVSPTAPWAYNYSLYGSGNTCAYGGLDRWGDYLTVRPYHPADDVWIASNYAIKGANCGSAGWYAEPHNVIFGRSRDGQSYSRWANY